MPHGTPDWAEMAPRSTVYGGIDLAELAARLGSPVTFDRRGDVIFLDGFESGLGAWEASATLLADVPTWSTVKVRNGGFSCKLNTSAAIDRRSDITQEKPLPALSKIGLEFSFTLEEDNTTVYCSLYPYFGTTRAEFHIRYNQADETFEYWGTDSDWHVFATGVRPYATEAMFNTLKLVVDLDAVKFVRCIFNSDTYDMAGLVPWNDVFDFTPFMQVQIRLMNLVAEAKYIYVDDVIITQNEP